MDYAGSGRSIVLKYSIVITILVSIACFNVSCGQSDGLDVDPYEYTGPVLLWNLSQFELLELYTHGESPFERGCNCDCNPECSDAERSNCGSYNQLCEPLQPDTATVIQWNTDSYISVVREKTRGGFLMSLTTQQPPQFVRAQSVLIVFDDGFRALVDADEAYATPGFPGFPDEILNYQPNIPGPPNGY